MLLTATGSLVSEYFFKDGSTESAANNDGIDEGESGNQQQYQERSRGRERRLIHERLRRQMLERAAANNLDGISTPTPGTNTIPNQQSQQETELGRDNATRISRRATSSSVPERFMTNVRQLSKVRMLPSVYSILFYLYAYKPLEWCYVFGRAMNQQKV
jgi:hypothetical protein